MPLARRISFALAAILLCGGAAVALPGSAQATTARDAAVAKIRCSTPNPPSWFYQRLQAAANADANIPDAWGHDVNMARIVCFESSFQVHATNGSYYGLGQMSKTNIAYYHVSFDDYWNGTSSHTIAFYQLLAALRYCKDRYGSPAAGWQHEINYNWW